LKERIREAQSGDSKLQQFREQVEAGHRKDFQIHANGALYFGDRICVPKSDVWQEVLAEAHSSTYSVHPDGTKMYHDLKQHFWWNGMKRER